MRKRFHVVIVGGGFSGIALAVRLIRRGAPGLRLTVLEAGDRLGRGVAYGTTEGAHVLNTRAGQMSLASDDWHFVRWNQRAGKSVAPSDFVTRRAFGDYAEDTLIQTIARGSDTEVAARTHARVADISSRSNGFCVALDDGQSIQCHAVVLATGHPLPSDPLERWLPPGSPHYLRNPWNHARFDSISADDRVLLLGTGLTMADAALMLRQRGHRAPIKALSRRGLLPRAHDEFMEELPSDLRMSLHATMAGGDLRQILRAVRRTIQAASRRGVSWHAVIDAMRPVTSTAWAKMSTADRRRFLRWLRPYWDVHRHRLAPAPAATIDAMLADGRLAVSSDRVQRACEDGTQIVVETRARGTAVSTQEAFDWIVNCTGPNYAARPARALEQRLVTRGLLSPDPLGLGYRTGPIGNVLGSNGLVPNLFVMGPACRPSSFEHTAVPELRQQADELAAALLNRGSAPKRTQGTNVVPFVRRRTPARKFDRKYARQQ